MEKMKRKKSGKRNLFLSGEGRKFYGYKEDAFAEVVNG
jgi:hypothetical protein